MAKKRHSNSLDNQNTPHLYGIYDFEKQEMYKFGISDKAIKEYTSSRLKNQVNLFNRVVGWLRFTGRILTYPICGRRKARQLEDEVISKFKAKHGKLPRGNANHTFLKNNQNKN